MNLLKIFELFTDEMEAMKSFEGKKAPVAAAKRKRTSKTAKEKAEE